MVSAAHPLAMQAGKRMLEDGGNAVDAAIASAFTLAVVEPSMSGLGGRLQAIIRLPDGRIRGVDATTQVPLGFEYATAPKGNYGYPVIGVPGVVAGLHKMWKDHGSLPWKTLLKPAIYYAEKGFALFPGEAQRHEMGADQWGEFEGSRKYFLSSDGDPYKAGEKWVQKDLANTLKILAEEGAQAFYEGAIAQKMVADHAKHEGALTMEALRAYRALDAKVVQGSYRDHELHGLWLPSYGAITIQILQILEHFPMDEYRGAAWASVLGQAIELAYENRDLQKTADSMANHLTRPEVASMLAQRINVFQKTPKTGTLYDGPQSWHAEIGHTTHLSTADHTGMMVALTQSLGPNMGSKVAAPGLGFLYATTIGEYLGMTLPGQRASSHISPLIITRNNEPVMALGAAGGSRIVTAISAVCSRVIDHLLPLEEALVAPRVYPYRDTLQIEMHDGTSWENQTLEKLEDFGFHVKPIYQPAHFGRIHAVQFDAQRKLWIGAADPDWEGAVGGSFK